MEPSNKNAAASLWWPTVRIVIVSRSQALNARLLASYGGDFLALNFRLSRDASDPPDRFELTLYGRAGPPARPKVELRAREGASPLRLCDRSFLAKTDDELARLGSLAAGADP